MSCPSRSPRHPTAAAAVEAFGTAIDPGAYNPSWLLVADRHDAFFVDVTATDEVVVERLQPGVHVLENRDLHEPSPKADRVRELLGPALHGRSEPRCSRSCRRCSPTTRCRRASHPLTPATLASPLAARAICVHADEDDYGTRSSAIITVDDQPGPPTIRWTGDAPCHARWERSDSLWSDWTGE